MAEAGIREAGERDLEQVLELYAELHPDDVLPSRGELGAVFDRITSTPGLHLLVLEDEAGRLVSSCYLNIVPNLTRGARPYALIENVVTRSELRRAGYGRQVIRYALEVAWGLGCYKVMLLTGSTDPGTHAFYASCGFSGTEKRGYVARP